MTGGDSAQLHAALAELTDALGTSGAERARQPVATRRRRRRERLAEARQWLRDVARSQLSSAGARICRVVDRAERRADRRRRATGLAPATARPSAGGPRAHAERGAAARERAGRSQLGVAAQQPARSGGSRAGCVRRKSDRRPALLLGRSRNTVGTALERSQHGTERGSTRWRGRSSGSSSARRS